MSARSIKAVRNVARMLMCGVRVHLYVSFVYVCIVRRVPSCCCCCCLMCNFHSESTILLVWLLLYCCCCFSLSLLSMYDLLSLNWCTFGAWVLSYFLANMCDSLFLFHCFVFFLILISRYNYNSTVFNHCADTIN